MSARAWLLFSALLGGCAHAPPPSKALGRAPTAAARPSAPLVPFELPELGLQLRAPAAMELFEHDSVLPDGPMHMQGAHCTVGSQEYSVARYLRDGRDRAKDEALLAGAKKGLEHIAREAPIHLGEWSGIELEGTDGHGQSTWMRVYVIGDGFWIAHVHRSTVGPLDEAPARAFLDSIVLNQPWSVHAFPEGHFSALMPDGAVRLDRKAMHSEDFRVAEASLVGGAELRMFYVWDMPLTADARTPDERMDDALSAMTGAGNRVIWQAPVVIDGERGRDFLVQSEEYWLRLRLVVTASDLYMLQAAARTKDGLLDPSVPRFLASLRWF